MRVALTQIAGSPFSVPGADSGLRESAYSPNGKFLAIVATGNVSELVIFNVANNGTLTLNASYTSNVNSPYAVQFFPNGNFLVITNLAGSTLSIFAVDSGGNLTFVQSIAALTFTSGLSISPNGNFAIVSDRGSSSNNVETYTIDQITGNFTQADIGTAQSSAIDVAFFPNGQFAAVTNLDSNSVTVFAVDQTTGVLTLVNNFDTQTSPRKIAFSPTGQFAAVTNRDSNTVTIYSVDTATGDFTPVTGSLATSSFATGNQPNAVTYSKDGTNLVLTNELDNTIAVYDVNNNGTLSFVTTYPTGGKPSFMSISPNGIFFAVPSSQQPIINVFEVNLQASNISGTTNCNTSVTILANACGVSPVLTSVGSPSNGTANFSGNSITYTPNNGFTGTDSFSYTVSDASGATSSAMATITVNTGANNINVTTQENTSIIIDVSSASCGNLMSITQPAHGTAQITGPKTINYTPNTNFIGIDTFTYTVDPSTATITVNVIEKLIPPTPPIPVFNESAIVRAIRQKYCKLLGLA